jgi:hypothetical protein
MRKGVAIAILVAILAIAGGYFYRYSLVEMITGGETRALQEAQKLIDEGRPVSALNWLRPFSREITQTTPIAAHWRQLYLKAALEAKDADALLHLYEGDPNIISENEVAALMVADRLIKLNRPLEYAHLHARWKGKETRSEVWFNLDADQKILQGDREGAIALLKSQTFEGKADTGRLVRLALLTIKEKPRVAWEYLVQASAQDPSNPEIRSYRARLLEVIGQTRLALNEYITAAQEAPDQIFYQDQLAEFYRRNRRYDLAVDVWKTQFKHPGADSVWLKAWFWTHVIAPLGIRWQDQSVPKGPFEPFLHYLADLKPGTFWNAEAFEKVPNAQEYLQTQQVTFWLRLLDALQKNKEDAAWELLQYNVFAAQSWNASLENLLRKVLTYRKIGTFNIDVAPQEPATSQPKASQDAPLTHPLFVEVNAFSVKGADVLAMSAELRELLTSALAIPSCFLAVGWDAAALDLTPQPISIPKGMPEWVTEDYTQAIRLVKGVGIALTFAEKQPPTPTLSLMIGEYLLTMGQLDDGAERLRPLAALDTETGSRAAWLLSLLYITRKQFDQARAVISAQPRLRDATLGRETFARISLLEGDLADADARYEEIQDKSWEAKSYFARKAFTQKNYPLAEQLTEELLRQFPNNQVLKKNLQRIQELKNQPTTSEDVEKEAHEPPGP